MKNYNAGKFSVWLEALKGSLEGRNSVNVPCGECIGCCTSSYFIHIKPTDIETLKYISKNIRFPAPNLPKGHYILGYDKNGHCPMFKQGKCSIYDFRPETCRQYDCRIYPATGLSLENDDNHLIFEQSKNWKFDVSSDYDLEAFHAVKSATQFIIEKKEYFPYNLIPGNKPEQAIFAICISDIFKGLTDKIIKEKEHELIKTITMKYSNNETYKIV